MIKPALSEGIKSGFSTVEVYKEKIEKQEFENFIDYNATHAIQIDRLIVRAFWDQGDPVGFCLYNPDLKSIKQAYLDIYSTGLPDRKENYAGHLPQSAEKVKINLFDDSIHSVAGPAFKELLENINEIMISFPDLHLNKIHLAKLLKKVYIANSYDLDIKYKKTIFHLALSFNLKGSRIEISDQRVFYNDLEPSEMVSQAFFLLNSLSEPSNFIHQEKSIILSPEASVFILREFSKNLKLDNGQSYKNLNFPAVLNIVDNPILDKQPGSIPFDDEGVQSGEKFLIQKGSFQQCISDIQTAFHYKTESTGNGFREKNNIFPVIRFSNLFIKPSVWSLKNLRNDVGKGLLVVLLKLKYRDNNDYYFSAYGYRFNRMDILEPVHFFFKTSFKSYFLNILKVSKEIKFFHSTYNIGSPYLLLEAKRTSANNFEV